MAQVMYRFNPHRRRLRQPPRGIGLYGRITDRWDGSVNGARVELVSGPDAGVAVFSMNPALYEFRNLRAGTYQVRVSREGYQTRDVQQELVADTELKIRRRTGTTAAADWHVRRNSRRSWYRSAAGRRLRGSDGRRRRRPRHVHERRRCVSVRAAPGNDEV